ncbi:MAG: hypothetical protein HQ541_10045, partial [Mariniphaga sp.]|nr:hypothetical protein [Mariniphaga sp.]
MSNLTYKESINEGCLKRIDSILKKKEVDLSKRVFKENLLSAEQIKVLDDYKNFCVGGGSGRIKSLSTTVTALCNMKTLGEFIKKPYKEVTRKDIERFSAFLKMSGKKDAYCASILIRVKSFYRWLYKTGEEYPAVVKWMKPQIKSEKIKFDDLPSEDDIKKL